MTIPGPTQSDEGRYSRRLGDKIAAAFDHACCDEDYVTAAELLRAMEDVLRRVPPHADMRDILFNPLLACHTRLWNLRVLRRPGANELAEPVAIARVADSLVGGDLHAGF